MGAATHPAGAGYAVREARNMNRRNLFISTAKAALATALDGSWEGAPHGNRHRASWRRSRNGAGRPHDPAIPPARSRSRHRPTLRNVLIVLIDDMGFGQSSPFGRPINMRTFEKLALRGCNTISSTPRPCARPPANHHINNMGFVTSCGRELKYLSLMVGYTRSSTWEAHRWVRPRSPCAEQSSSKQ